MKTNLLIYPFLFLLMISGLSVQAQEEFPARTEEYCKVRMISFIGRQGVEVRMDYGQEQRRLRDTELQDEDGNPMSFYSEAATLNYLNSKGWELVTALSVNNEVFYLMRRRI